MDNVKNIDDLAIVGIQTRGVELANRIKAKIETLSGKSIKSGILDITFYRDDIATRGVLPEIKETRIDFDISNMTILLVDDVIFTGRTTKAAIETLMSFGRPRAIRLFVLIDRGSRELPIQPDYCGYKTETTVHDKVKVRLQETDNLDDVVILS
ncbi:MAG TPA: bifunctional pyr operon transcriptional regulator/uracil phosphoribosyltransferase PyrR [Spirochaetota bacterium]|nr:bifunctional pyr operon transcriptional regulator/uracil phosphoribosyltransferase PyrR [Spirochaetota bacterium]